MVAFLWQGPSAPAAPPLGPSSWPVSALGTVADVQPHPELSLSLHSSSAVAAARACQWASLALASSHSPEVSHLPLWEAQLQWQEGQVLVDSGSPPPPDCSPLLCLRWSFKEDTMSFVISHALSGPHGGGPGNLLSAFT